MGWGEVAAGINRILLGNLVLIFMPLFGVLLIVVALTSGGDPMSLVETDKFKQAGYEMFFLFLGGVLAIVASAFIGYPLILFGRIRCLVNVPERCGAKWLMFVCVLALVAGPALGILAGVLGAGRDMDLEKSSRKVSSVQGRGRDAEAARREILSEVVLLAERGQFRDQHDQRDLLLALPACSGQLLQFHDPRAMVDFYFILLGGILAATGYVLFGTFGHLWH
jgi:hypothetical protein